MLSDSQARTNKVAADKFRPIDIPKDDQARSRATESMAHRIVKTYLTSSAEDKQKGETFYSQNAHGAARALSLGLDPNGAVGKMMRSTPSPGEKQSEWQGGKAVSQPSSASTGHPVNTAIQSGVRRASGVLARLSPQTDWDENVKQAHEAYHLPDDTVHELMNDKRQGLHGKVLNNQPSATVLSAHAIASGRQAPDENVQTGKKRVKIGSFLSNIAEPDTSPHTTVDFRAHDIAAGKLLPTSQDRGLGAKGRYSMYEQAHERATEILNKKPGQRIQSAPLQPKQVQATAWWTDKRDVDTRLGGGGARKGSHLHAGMGKTVLTRGHLGKPAGQ